MIVVISCFDKSPPPACASRRFVLILHSDTMRALIVQENQRTTDGRKNGARARLSYAHISCAPSYLEALGVRKVTWYPTGRFLSDARLTQPLDSNDPRVL